MRRLPVLLLLPFLAFSGCQTLQEVANLRTIDFAIDGVNQTYLAGIDIDGVRSQEDLITPVNGLRLANALRQATQNNIIKIK